MRCKAFSGGAMKPLCKGILIVIVGLCLAGPAGFAAPRQSQQQTQQQPQAQPQQDPQQQTQQPPATATDTSQQPQTQDQGQTSSSDEDQNQTPKNVKPGSEKDVNAVGNRNVGKGVNLYSLEREIALGKQAAQEVEKSSKLVNDPVVTEYVNRVGQNLVRNSDAKVPFTIKRSEEHTSEL